MSKRNGVKLEKILLIAAIMLLTLVFSAGCRRQPSDSPNMPVGRIIEYLPITLDDQFELTSAGLFHNYPYGKTEFTDAEALYGSPPFLIAKSDAHITRIYFIWHSQWGTLASATSDNIPQQWFTVETDAFHELTGLIGWYLR